MVGLFSAGHEANGMKAYFENGEGRGRIEMAEEAFNVKIEFVPLTWDGAVDSILTSILAGILLVICCSSTTADYRNLLGRTLFFP